MTELIHGELFLKGRVQIEAALRALAYTGINPDAQHRLQVLLDTHAELSVGESQDDLSVYLQGEAAEWEKSDIVTSLDAVKDGDLVSADERAAAAALHEILY